MFFDRKMQLVWVDGDSSLLERFVQQCCIGNNLVHPTSAVSASNWHAIAVIRDTLVLH